MKLPNGINKVIEVIERRNHAGVFNNPEDKKNGFFRVKCSFERLASGK